MLGGGGRKLRSYCKLVVVFLFSPYKEGLEVFQRRNTCLIMYDKGHLPGGDLSSGVAYFKEYRNRLLLFLLCYQLEVRRPGEMPLTVQFHASLVGGYQPKSIVTA